MCFSTHYFAKTYIIHQIPMFLPPLQTLLIVGAETKIGQLCCRLFSRLGYNVVGTTPHPLSNLPVPLMLMDVRDEASVQKTIPHIEKLMGPISAVINVAGMDELPRVVASTIPVVQDQLEQRFFASVRVCKAIIPLMRRSGAGLILQASGLSGIPGVPELEELYQAVNYSIAGITHSLNIELNPFNIHLVNLSDYKRIKAESTRQWMFQDNWIHKPFGGEFNRISRFLQAADEEIPPTVSMARMILEVFQVKAQEVPWPGTTTPLRIEPRLEAILDSFQQASLEPQSFRDEYMKCRQN